MSGQLKPIDQQVILITGASSGIGRQTATRAAAKGAKLILVARNGAALDELAAEINDAGGSALTAVADVADSDQLKAAADAGVAKFGRIDTWINNAGVGLYTKILDADVADDRRLFETNFWGIVNGSRIAVPHLAATGGGALINVGSVTSDLGAPIQTMYTASKHAVMAFTDGLRAELMAEQSPVTVTLIKPSAINTPFPKHAKINLDHDGTLPPPLYDVDLAADQILFAAERGVRDLYVGGGGRITVLLGRHFPTIADWFMSSFGISAQLADRPPERTFEGLHTTKGFHQAKGEIDRDHHVRKVSLYNLAVRHPLVAAFAVAGGASLLGWVAKETSDRRRS